MKLSATTIGNGFLFPDFSFMLRKKDYENAIRKYFSVLSERADHPIDEIDTICKAMPIRIMKDGDLLAVFCLKKGFSIRDSLTILSWVVSQFDFLNDIKVRTDVSYVDACNTYGQAQTNTIVLHRVNYMLHECMIEVINVLEKEGRFRFSVKKAYNEADKVWDKYYHDRRRKIEDSAWYTLSDHLRLSDNAISPFREKVYEAIRDGMIGRGIRDVELKGRCAVFFLMGKVAGHSFRHFFEDFERESGVDYSCCFSDDDIYGMVEDFAKVCELLGIGTEKDEHGFLRLSEYDPEKSQRFCWAWDRLIAAIRDDDLMDMTAKNAIEMNPETKKEYEHVLAEQERDRYNDSLLQLGEKYNVKKL